MDFITVMVIAAVLVVGAVLLTWVSTAYNRLVSLRNAANAELGRIKAVGQGPGVAGSEVARRIHAYNDIARQFNATADGAPSSIMCAILGMRKLEYLEPPEEAGKPP